MPAAAQTTDTADSRQRWKCICAVFKGVMSGSFYSNVNSVINSAITQVVFWHIWSSNTTLQGSFSILITQLPAWMCLCSCEAAWGPGLRLKVVQRGIKKLFPLDQLLVQLKELLSHSRGDSLGLWSSTAGSKCLSSCSLGGFCGNNFFF